MVRRSRHYLLLLALLVGLLLSALPALAQSLTLAEALDELRGNDPTVSERFRRDNGLWELDLDSDESTIRYESGTYRVGALEPGYFVWGISELVAADLFVEVDATPVAGPENNEFGIVFRHVDTENFYTFLVGSDGFYSLRKLEQGQWEEIIPWTETDLLEGGDEAVNRLGVFAQGENIALLINEQVVEQVRDGTFSGGALGLAAGAIDEGGVEVAFDNLELWDLAQVDLPAISDLPSDEPTEEPTEEPVDEPTPELTPEPIDVPEIVPLALDADAVQARVEEVRAGDATFSEGFRTDSGLWSLETDETVSFAIEGRELAIEVVTTNWMGWSLLSEPHAADLLIEADMGLIEGPASAEYGIVFRYVDGDNFYFTALTGLGTWGMWRLVDNEWTTLIDWSESDAIDTSEGAVNRLAVLAEGDLISVLINDESVGQVRDDAPAAGALGLAVGTFDESGARVFFDDVDLWVLADAPVDEPVEDPEPVETPEPAPDLSERLEEITAGEPTVRSDFRRDDGSWVLSTEDDVFASYARRALVIEVDRSEWTTRVMHAEISAADFLVEIDTTFVDGPETGEYGIVFRKQDNNFYLFAISGSGYYGLFRSDDGEWTDVIPWTASGAITAGSGAVNRLAVLAEGPTVTLIVNGEVLAQAEDATYSEGGLGLAAGTFSEDGLQVSFDNFHFWQLD